MKDSEEPADEGDGAMIKGNIQAAEARRRGAVAAEAEEQSGGAEGRRRRSDYISTFGVAR